MQNRIPGKKQLAKILRFRLDVEVVSSESGDELAVVHLVAGQPIADMPAAIRGYIWAESEALRQSSQYELDYDNGLIPEDS